MECSKATSEPSVLRAGQKVSSVIELMAILAEMPDLKRPGPGVPPPPKTPPVRMQTGTRSGEGHARIKDDEMTDHLYE